MAFLGLVKIDGNGSFNNSDGAGNGTVEIKAASIVVIADNHKTFVTGDKTITSTPCITGQLEVANDETAGGKVISLFVGGKKIHELQPGEKKIFLADSGISQLSAQADIDDPAYRCEVKVG